MPPNESVHRSRLIERITAIVLADGLDALSLRPLAARLNTSGRMLLYHFGSKDVLVRAVLGCIAERTAALQDAASSGAPESAGRFLDDLMRAGTDPDTAPLARVWAEVIARAARGEMPYREVADRTVAGWLDWIAGRLPPSPDTGALAAAVLAIVEGITLLEAARPGTTAAARRLLPALLDRAPRRGEDDA